MNHQDDAAPQLLAEAVSRETADSKILWSARASPWAYARNRLKSFWVGVLFTAFAVFWTWGAFGGFSKHDQRTPVFFAFSGFMFIAFGLCILLSPIFALWKARRVFYIVTDRRAIIFEKIWSLKIQSF